MLLEDVVDQDLKEDEENDDDAVALLEEGAALRPACRATPQHADAPANTQVGRVGGVTWRSCGQNTLMVRRHQRLSHLFMSSCVCFIDSMAL